MEQKLTAKRIQLIWKFNLQLFKCFNCRTSGWEWMDRKDSEFESQHLHVAIMLSTTDLTYYITCANASLNLDTFSSFLWHFYLSFFCFGFCSLCPFSLWIQWRYLHLQSKTHSSQWKNSWFLSVKSLNKHNFSSHFNVILFQILIRHFLLSWST